jgi:hypothetical protein
MEEGFSRPPSLDKSFIPDHFFDKLIEYVLGVRRCFSRDFRAGKPGEAIEGISFLAPGFPVRARNFKRVT